MTLRNNTLLLIVFGASAIFGAGCVNGPSGPARTSYCPHNYDPMELNATDYSNKLEIKPGQAFTPPVGDYAYKGSQIYYFDTVSDVKIHLAQTLNEGTTNTFTYSILCVGGQGYKNTMEPISVSIPIISDLSIDSSGHSQIRTKRFIIKFKQPESREKLRLNYSVVDDSAQYKPGSPADTYPNYREVSQFFAKTVTLDFYHLLSYMKSSVLNNEIGNTDHLVIRTLISLEPVTPPQRKEIDKKHGDGGITSP